MIKKILSFALFFALFSLTVEAKTLYVDQSIGNDSVTYEANSSSNPWRTIGRAAWGSTNRSLPNSGQAARAGDTVYITAGIYSNVKPDGVGAYYVAWNPINSGTSGNPIVFEAIGTVILTQNGSPGLNGNATGRAVIGASMEEGPGTGQRSYITWRGFTINEVNVNSVNGVALIYGGTGNRIENCILDGGGGSVMSSNNHPAIYITGTETSGAVIRNNRIYNWLNGGVYDSNSPGVMLYYASNVIIEHNEIYNSGAGIFLKGGDHKNSTIRYNNIYSTRVGIRIQYNHSSQSENKVYQNLVRCTSGTEERYGIFILEYTNNTKIINNTVVGCTDGGLYFSHVSSPRLFQNNIVYQSSGEVANGGNCTNPGGVSFDYNSYYNSQAWSINGRAYYSITNWRNALGGCPGAGNDCGSATSDPLFVDVANHNYKLQVGSPARTLGRTITEIHGSSGETIPAGAYITGNEVIGRIVSTSNPPSPPTDLRIQ